ncbi:hypothetical protein FRC06_002131 [Ceratobasidium sp. 370]|nr:hypothetical protein FRC06_002131 [Ceratobasidium sp. 370]
MKPFSLVDRQSGRNRAREGLIPAENHPLSPPDTEISSQLDPYATPSRRPSLAHPDPIYALPTIPATPEATRESAGARFRRLAGIPTTQSGPREFRGASRPQTRWLIVLMPPPHLTDELAVGHRSPGRIANGLLIPLFPTLFAQLTAIAKEFSLPSTTGLCLYLHLPDAPATPRITDDAWPLLWSRHLHTDDSALPLGLPVAGRVEFDIDIPNARWYPMWFAHVSRQELVPDLARAIPPSPRGLGRDLSPNGSTRAPKSVPRPLALVPRDEPVVQVDSAPSPVPSTSGPKSASKETVEKVRRWSALVTPNPAVRVDSLSTELVAAGETIVPPSTNETPAPLLTEETPEDEPLNLEDFQWSITSAGPPSPTSSCATSASSRVISVHLLQRNEGSVLLTPTTATSWGAPSVSDVESDLNLNLGWRVRSPDIGERAEGSVLLTPSTATSWGAPLSYPPTPAQWIAMQELVRSPDLGERAEGSVLLTPSTATTWGAPLSYPPTPAQWYAMQQYVRSPDAGQRAEGSVLLTPSTATTWGAPEMYPPTPEAWTEARVASPDLGMRAEVEGEFGRGRNSTMVWGVEVETEQEAYARMGLPWVWEFGWPRLEGEVLEAVAEEPELGVVGRGDQEVEESAPIVFVTREDKPEMEAMEAFDLGWPRFDLAADDASLEGNSALDEGHSVKLAVLGSDRGQGAETDAFEYDLPRFDPVPLEEEDDILDAVAPDTFEYELPHFELVEGEGEDEDEGEGEYTGPDAVTPDTFDYPTPDFEPQASDMHVEHLAFVNSPASIIAPRSVILATTTVASTTATTRTRSYGEYPFLVIYPVMYPHLNLYPAAPAATVAMSRSTLNLATQATRTQATDSTVGVAKTTGPAKRASTPRSVGPDPVRVGFVPSPVESTRTASSQTEPSAPSPPSRKPSLSVHVPRARSSTIIAVNAAAGRSRAWSRALPPVPPVPPEVLARLASSENTRNIAAPAVPQQRRKPSIVLDNTGFELLPSKKQLALSSAYSYRYPYNLAQLYPPVRTLGYPYNLEVLYPWVVKASKSVSGEPVAKGPEILLATRPAIQRRAYPLFDLYPAVYPHNLLELYPPVYAPVWPPAQSTHTSNADTTVGKQPGSTGLYVPIKRLSGIQVRLSPRYPALDLFPPVYPRNLECIYPAPSKDLAQLQASTIKPVHAVSEPPSALPLAQSVAASNADAMVGKRAGSIAAKRLGGIQVRLSLQYPALDPFPSVYPYNLERIYPAPPKDLAQLQVSTIKPVHAVPEPPSALPLAQSVAASNADAMVGKQTGLIAVKKLGGIRVRLSPQYPTLDLFPPVYPYNLKCIYPASLKDLTQSQVSTTKPVHAVSKPLVKLTVRLARVYPSIELYAPVYPFNLDIYPLAQKDGLVFANSNFQERDEFAGLDSDSENKVIEATSKSRKTHAQLCVEVWRKTHMQLVAEVAKQAAPMRVRKSHDKLQAEVFPDGLPGPVPSATVGPQVLITPVPLVNTTPKPELTPQPVAAPLRRQRSGTIMMRGPPAPAESAPPLPPLPPAFQGADLGRSRSMVEARTQVFERAAPARSQTIGAPRLMRGKNASFERAMTLFHTPEEPGKAVSEGSRTPPRISRNVSKLDMSKFKFS